MRLWPRWLVRHTIARYADLTLSPCGFPGCASRAPFRKRYCEAHDKQTRRASSTLRSRDKTTRYSDAPWRKLRAVFLAASPLCVMCQDEGIVTSASVVDHIEPVTTHPHMRLDWDNLRSLCASHHNAHTARTRGWRRASR